jgi:hypothetical protein
MNHDVPWPQERIDDFCRRWRIERLELFGSVLREDFHAGSDVDILVTFTPEAQWSLLDHIRMEEELSDLLGRKVDLVSRRAVERSRNPIRREGILSETEVVYEAR